MNRVHSVAGNKLRRGVVSLCALVALALPVGEALAAWVQAGGTSGVRFISMSRVGTTLYAGSVGSGLYQSTDDGATWSTAFGSTFNLWSPQVVAQVGSLLYVGGGKSGAAHLAYSSDGGASWTDLSSWGTATTITDVKLINGVSYVAAYGQGVYKSTSNNGTGWSLTNTGMATQPVVRKLVQMGTEVLVADATNNGSDGVYHSTDNGATWSRLANSPSGNGSAVSNLINLDGTLYFAGGSGVWRSVDSGANWTRVFNSGSYAMERNNATLYLAPDSGISLYTSTDGTTWNSQSVTGITAPYLQPGIVLSGGKLMLASGDGIWRETDPTPSYAVTVTAPSLGTVTSNSGGINCGSGGSTCAAYYLGGASVSLTATPNSGYLFSSWGGSCSGSTNPLALTVNADMGCTASFVVANVAPTVSGVSLTGTLQVGTALSGSYTYQDNDGDLENTTGTGSHYRYVRSTDNSLSTLGDNSDLTSGATGGAGTTTAYTPVNGDVGGYLFYCVTPAASSGTTPGTEVCSAALGPVPTPVNGVCDATNQGQILINTPSSNLCTTGAASAVTPGNTGYSWSCAGSLGGTPASCTATRQYLVSTSAGSGGSISASQQVVYQASPAFTLTPQSGYRIQGVSGCGGSLVGTVYTVAPVSANCTVSASFVANVAPSFVGSTTVTLGQNAPATDLKGLFHGSDPDAGQTLTWTQSGAPSHGTLSLSGTTAPSGGTDITPGGSLIYTPAPGYVGNDSFTVQLSDGMATATRTVTVTITAATASQSNLPTAQGGVSARMDVVGCTSIDSPSFGAAPPGNLSGVSFPFGLLDFTLSGCTSTATVTVTYSQNLPPRLGFYKYLNGHYSTYPATLTANSVTYTLTDGGAGDADGQVDQRIVDPGGLGLSEGTPVPASGPASLALVAALLALIGFHRLRRPV